MSDRKEISDAFGLTAKDYKDMFVTEIQEHQRNRYIEIMLGRLSTFSAHNRAKIMPGLNNNVFHASLHKGIEKFDPARGQGLGVWFQDRLEDAADFAVFRSESCLHDDGVEPTIYEARLKFNNIAVFSNESFLYRLYVEDVNDSEDLRLGLRLDYGIIRNALVSAGYDGVALMTEGTYSVLAPKCIHPVLEHNPFQIDQQSMSKPSLGL